MKTTTRISAALLVLSSLMASGQAISPSYTIDSLASFNKTIWTNFYNSHHSSALELPEFLKSHQRDYIKETYFPSYLRLPGINSTPQLACTNIDFENGSLSGWTTSTGYNPIYNPAGCCLTSGGAQVITAGAGLDPCGGFPVVAPGGTFSLKLGDNNTGGIADRIEQTFFVTPSNANFMYKYAVVFQDPGHTVIDQPSFQAEMVDSLGNQIPCTYYSVSAGAGIPGFLNSTGCAGVVYKPWSNVSVDLTSYIGQNVTIKFTTQDCALGGHYAYAYIDGSCASFNINQSNILCQGTNIQLTAPLGFATYNWTLPDLTTQTGQIITTSLPGVYVLTMTTITGCPGPTLTYTLIEFPKPTTSFIFTQPTPCSSNFSFTNLTSIPFGSIASSLWGFGDTGTSTATNPLHTYSGLGSYSVSLISISNMGCTDTAYLPVSIQPFPIASFISNTVCLNSNTTFTNTSNISSGAISSYYWQFGDGTSSVLLNPTHLYSTSGSFLVSLTVTSSFGCNQSYIQVVTVNPLPNVVITATNNCLGITTTYTNSSSISLGTITNYLWDYNLDGITDNTFSNGSFTFLTPGTYTTQLTAISNFNCSATQNISIVIYPNPVAAFSNNTVCNGLPTLFNNSSTISSGYINSNVWQFGDLTSSTIFSPSHLYSSAISYNALLTVTSNFNCSNSVSGIVNIYPKPTVNFISSIACLNQASGFTNTSNIISGSIIKYLWDFDNNGINDDSTINPTHVYPIAGISNCKLKALSNFNCVNENTNPVLVHANPTANFYCPSTCLPQTTNFTNVSTSTDGLITSYNWDFNGDFLTDNVSTNPNYIFTSAGNYGVQLEVQTQFGCTNKIIKSVYVNATPQVVFSAQNNKGCPLLCVNFTNSCSIGSGGISTYQWIFGDGSPADYSSNPTHCYQTGNYNVTLKAVSDSGCVASSTLPNLVNVYPTPIADFNVTPTTVDVTAPLIEVTDKSIGASSVKYIFSDGTIKNVPNFSHFFVTDDAKTILIMQKVVNTYGCRDSIVKVLDIKPAYVIYIPNAFTPNSDGLNDGFKALGMGIKDFKLQIFDRWGEMVFESDDINKAWDGTINSKGDYESTKEDVYVWKVQVKDLLSKQHDLIGHVTLVK